MGIPVPVEMHAFWMHSLRCACAFCARLHLLHPTFTPLLPCPQTASVTNGVAAVSTGSTPQASTDLGPPPAGIRTGSVITSRFAPGGASPAPGTDALDVG